MERLAGLAQNMLDRIEASDFERSDVVVFHLAVAKARCGLDPKVSDFWTWEAWVKAMQIGSALFSAGMAPQGESVHFRVGREDKSLPALGPRDYLTAENWLDAFYLAAICRESDRMRQLASIPMPFLRTEATEVEEYLFLWAEALQSGLHRDSEKMWNSLIAVAEKSAPEGLPEPERAKALELLSPLIEMFRYLMERDATGFNSALGKALNWHKAYWAENDPASVDGLVALAPLALACIAYDAGVDIEVESEYMPQGLLVPEWVGEMDT
ncbi:immunity 49 family protein [Streptomyces sp. NPDC048111]|uniref:immunity 49 family protein n=1 Tax=Streptomyces sp. NPDC048111 TaxID=3365500 RepID=UPI00371694A9